MTNEEINEFNFSKKPLEEDEWGYVFCIDLDYEEEKKVDLIQFPFPPEKRILKLEHLSQFQKNLVAPGDSSFVESERVLQTLYLKTEQVYYWNFLYWMITHGAKIVKVHCGMKFKESKIFSSFAQNNINARNNASCKFDKEIRKSLNNNLVGKSTELATSGSFFKFFQICKAKE